MFSKKNLAQIPKEDTPHASGSRKLVATKEEVGSPNFEALTQGFLPAGEKWFMHSHPKIIEICIAIKGTGVIRDEKGEEEGFKEGDRFIFPTNTKHEIENTGKAEAQFFFFRFRA